VVAGQILSYRLLDAVAKKAVSNLTLCLAGRDYKQTGHWTEHCAEVAVALGGSAPSWHHGRGLNGPEEQPCLQDGLLSARVLFEDSF